MVSLSRQGSPNFTGNPLLLIHKQALIHTHIYQTLLSPSHWCFKFHCSALCWPDSELVALLFKFLSVKYYLGTLPIHRELGNAYTMVQSLKMLYEALGRLPFLNLLTCSWVKTLWGHFLLRPASKTMF